MGTDNIEEVRENYITEESPSDYANQIILAFKHLKHGVDWFGPHPVMEAGEEDMMHEIIVTALERYAKSTN